MNNNISQEVSQFEIIEQQKICRAWDNGQDFSNFEEIPCQGKPFDKKTLYLTLEGLAPSVLVVSFHFDVFN